MKYVIDSPDSFSESLALDEALLEYLESEPEADALLRFWSIERYGAVLGYSNKVSTEIDAEGLERIGGAVYRRTSGGGTVLIGPGCLSYSLILRCDGASEFATIGGANRLVMAKNARAVERLGRRPISVRGHTDLVWGDRKFCGNAQRRKQRAFLFHGVLLLSMRLDTIETALRFPSIAPDYRAARGHLEFVTNLEVAPDAVMAAFREEWGASAVMGAVDWANCQQRALELERERFATESWRFKY